jgi:hypothetical protein
LKRFPLFNFIYGSIKDFTEAFVGDDKKFNEPVLVDIDAHGLKKIGFLTQKDLQKIEIFSNELNETWGKISTKLYQQSETESSNGSSNPSDEVQDADFEEYKLSDPLDDVELEEWHFNLFKIHLQNISATNPTGLGFERAGEFQSEEQHPQSWMSVSCCRLCRCCRVHPLTLSAFAIWPRCG